MQLYKYLRFRIKNWETLALIWLVCHSIATLISFALNLTDLRIRVDPIAINNGIVFRMYSKNGKSIATSDVDYFVMFPEV